MFLVLASIPRASAPEENGQWASACPALGRIGLATSARHCTDDGTALFPTTARAADTEFFCPGRPYRAPNRSRLLHGNPRKSHGLFPGCGRCGNIPEIRRG